ncbi:MAG: sterol desaturase family protein [Gammaproteobacteria bacterium]|nr:sterol desaturase family protein [Gammaproteobacteria bacterium]
MTEFITQYETPIRLGFFLGIFALMCVWEILAPKRDLTVSKATRWLSNLSIVILNTLLLRLLFPAAAVGVAIVAQSNSWGLFNYFSVPGWLALFLSVILLDMVIYWQHVFFHKIPVLWRIHRMHHADMDIDVTTGSRFHPVEIILSMLIKFAIVIALGVPAVAVIVFEVILNLTAMFNHSNVRLPLGLDKIIRLFIVTPDMHRVHHSVIPKETNSNFGFNLSVWDKIFRTYKAQPDKGHLGMTIGLHEYRDEKVAERLPGMLMIPFKD